MLADWEIFIHAYLDTVSGESMNCVWNFHTVCDKTVKETVNHAEVEDVGLGLPGTLTSGPDGSHGPWRAKVSCHCLTDGGGAVYNFSHSPKKLHAKTV